MAQDTTSYEQTGGNSSYAMMAEMGLWMGSHWASSLEQKIFAKMGAWKGSAKATHAAYRATARSAEAYLGSRYGSRLAGKGAQVLRAVMPAQETAYAGALNLLQRRGGGMLSKTAITAAGRRGISKQFAMLAASRLGRSIYTGLSISMWAPLVFQGAAGAVTTLRSIGRKGPRQEFGERFFDNQSTYTERQRSIRAITSSRLSTRSAIGGEAQLMHR